MASFINNFDHNTIDDLNKHYTNKASTYLRILQWNIRGMNDLGKFDSLLEFLDRCDVPLDIIVIGETWLKQENTALYNIPGYSAVFSCRQASNGGLAVYVQSHIKHRIVSNEVNEGLHHLFVELNIHGHLYDIHGVYRPPSFDTHAFCDHLEQWMDQTNSNHSCFFVGDINIPINLSNNNVVIKYRTLLQSYGYLITNTVTSRPMSGNILDHVICKVDDANGMRNDTVFTNSSDHMQIMSSVKLNFNKESTTLTKNVIDHQRLQAEFHHYLNGIDQIDDADVTLNEIIESYNNVLRRCTRTVTKTIKLKTTSCPWMSYDLWALIKLKDNCLKRAKNNPTDEHLKALLRHVSKKVENAKQRAKKNYFENLLNSTCHSKTWKNLNQIFGRKKQEMEISLNVNGTMTTSTKEACEVLNTHFTTVGKNLASSIPKNSTSDPCRNIQRVRNSIFLRPSSSNEVLLLINDLNVSKSKGPDNISPKVVKNNALVFSFILSEIFNLIISNGKYPECLKTSKVIPVFKSGDSSQPSNYRPISILSILNKIIEKMLVKRFTEFFEMNSVLTRHQYGFRPGSNTETAIVELVDYVTHEIEGKNVVGGLFLDLKKAFDTLNHKILLRKLEYYGVRGLGNRLIESYLTNRKQFVAINGEYSTELPLDTGVPQGSNIGPLLFLIYVNDISKQNLKGIPWLFADDTALFYPGSNSQIIISNIENDLKLLSNYFEMNLLSLNLTKTKFMIFHSSRKQVLTDICPMLGQVAIERVYDFKYLGIILDPTLSWDNHIKLVEKKVAVLCGLMRRVSSFVSQKALLKYYFACIHSIFKYLCIVWGTACKSKLRKLQTLQNRCIKVVFKLPHLHPSVSLYTSYSHKILPIRSLCEFQTCLFIYDVIHSNSKHHNLSIGFINHMHNTRQANQLLRLRANTNLGQKRISCKGPQVFNSLPNDLKVITNKIMFKAKLNQHFKTRVYEFI